jgi:hypothetical protein
MIGTILNQVRQARARELRELTAAALAEAQLQSYATHAIEEAHKLTRTPQRHPADRGLGLPAALGKMPIPFATTHR